MDHVTPICTVHISKKKTSMAGDRIIKKEDRKIPKLTGKKIGCVVFFFMTRFSYIRSMSLSAAMIND